MCGRFAIGSSAEGIAAHFGVLAPVSLAPRYNVAPSQPVPALRWPLGRAPELVLLRWGLVPTWAKDPGLGARMINARAETLAAKPAFRSAFGRRRCLLPATGFYEWRAGARGRQPYFIFRSDGEPMAFAGLWERWSAPDGAVLESCTIVTTAANELLAPIHDRMPVVLEPQNYRMWLDPQIQEPDRLAPLLRPLGANALQAYPVSTRVNSPANDDPECPRPLDSGDVAGA